ncbi:hypothetical protein ACFLXI_06455 [Chloroflexota bacterium]
MLRGGPSGTAAGTTRRRSGTGSSASGSLPWAPTSVIGAVYAVGLRGGSRRFGATSAERRPVPVSAYLSSLSPPELVYKNFLLTMHQDNVCTFREFTDLTRILTVFLDNSFVVFIHITQSMRSPY